MLSALSPAQIVGGALAAATAAALGARIGVAGTVIGAAFASLATAIGREVYSETLRRTHDGISDAMSRQGRVSRSAGSTVAHAAADERTVANEPDAQTGEGGSKPPSAGGPLRRRRWAVIAVSALASFAIAAVVVTMVETATGRGLDGAPASTISRIGESNPAPEKPGSDEPKTAPATPAVEGEEPAGGAENQPPSQPSEPAAPGETRPDAQAPTAPGEDGQQQPGDAPGAESPPSASQPSSKGEPPAAGESRP